MSTSKYFWASLRVRTGLTCTVLNYIHLDLDMLLSIQCFFSFSLICSFLSNGNSALILLLWIVRVTQSRSQSQIPCFLHLFYAEVSLVFSWSWIVNVCIITLSYYRWPDRIRVWLDIEHKFTSPAFSLFRFIWNQRSMQRGLNGILVTDPDLLICIVWKWISYYPFHVAYSISYSCWIRALSCSSVRSLTFSIINDFWILLANQALIRKTLYIGMDNQDHYKPLGNHQESRDASNRLRDYFQQGCDANVVQVCGSNRH